MTVADRGVIGSSLDARSSASAWSRITAVSGLVFVVLFVAGMMLTAQTPEYDAPDQEWLGWYDDAGNRAVQIVSLFTLTLSALALVVFNAGLCRRLRSYGDDGWVHVAGGAGLLAAVAVAIGGVIVNGMSGAIEIGGLPVPAADVLKALEQLAFGIVFVAGGLFASLFVTAASLAARGTPSLPGWIVVTGFVAAMILLFSVLFFPMLALPLWTLIVSVHLVRRPDPGINSAAT